MRTCIVIMVLCVATLVPAPAHAEEHLLFRSAVYLEAEDPYRVFLSLHFHESQGRRQTFTIRLLIEKIDPEEKTVSGRAESAQTVSFMELVTLGEKGFSLFAIPGTALSVLYLKVLDCENPQGTIGLSYPIDARPEQKQWGWLPLSIVRLGPDAFGLVDGEGIPYQWIKMEVNYQPFWGIRPVGFSVFQPASSGEPLPGNLAHRLIAD